MNYNKAVFEAAYGTSKQLPKDENIEFFGICSESDYNDIYYVYID